jgi:DNA-binding transcriptional LysR family regulator
VELRHLEYFVTVAEERHFTRAAARLHIAQSGLSASIRALEQELGAPLFTRSTRRVELTDAGRALLSEARRTLDGAAAARDAVAAVRGLLRGTLSVGTEQCLGAPDVPSTLAAFRLRHPGVRVELLQDGSSSLIDKVRQGQLDVAFVAVDSLGDTPGLLPMMVRPMVVLCDPSHWLADRSTVDLASIADEVFIDFPANWAGRAMADAAFARAGLRRKVGLQVNDVHTQLELLGHGLGIAIVPEPIAGKPQASTLHRIALEGQPMRWHVCAAIPPDGRPTPAARALLDQIPELKSAAELVAFPGTPG